MAKAQALKLEGGRRERPSLGVGKRVWKKRLSAFLEVNVQRETEPSSLMDLNESQVIGEARAFLD